MSDTRCVFVTQMSDQEIKKWRKQEFNDIQRARDQDFSATPFWGRKSPMPIEPLGMLMPEPKYKLPNSQPDFCIPNIRYYQESANAIFNIGSNAGIPMASSFHNATRGPIIFLWRHHQKIIAAFKYIDQKYADATQRRSWWKDLMDGPLPDHSEMKPHWHDLELILRKPDCLE